MPADIQKIIENKKVIVCLGAGGVGKTTMSIVISTLAAMSGKKVALLSIDPAKRLASALGIPLGNKLSHLDIPDEFGVTGSIHAAMLDQKAVFDSMVNKHSPSVKIAKKIINHPLYVAASNNLSGPLEYMALAKLQELVDDSNFDFIVLDTPPDTQALDFLARPNLLAGFMEHKVINWLIKPFVFADKLGFGRIMAAGERGVVGNLGLVFCHSSGKLSEFLVLTQDVIEGFHKSGERIIEILQRDTSSFFLVTVPTFNAARSIKNIYFQLKKMGYRHDLLLLNRILPADIAAALDNIDKTEEKPVMALKRRYSVEKEIKIQLQSEFDYERSQVPGILEVDEVSFDLLNIQAVFNVAQSIIPDRSTRN